LCRAGISAKTGLAAETLAKQHKQRRVGKNVIFFSTPSLMKLAQKESSSKIDEKRGEREQAFGTNTRLPGP